MATTAYSGMLQERADLTREARSLLAAAESAGRGLTAAEKRRDDEIHARLMDIESEIAEEEARRAVASEAHSAASQPIGKLPWAPGPKYAQVFGAHHQVPNPGFKSFSEFCAGIQAGMWDARYQALLSGGSNDDGATALQIPGEYSRELFDLALESEIVRPRARIFSMNSDSRTIAGFTVGAGGAPFGITGGWTAQGDTIGEANPQSLAKNLTAHGLKVIVQVTNEALADSASGSGPSIDQQLSAALPRGLGWLLDKAFLSGTGVGSPHGAITDANPARIVVDPEVGQATNTITYRNLTTMFSRMHPGSRMNAVWVANSSAIPDLLELSIPIGVGGAHIPAMREDGSGGFTILTRPVLFTEKVPALGEAGDVSLIDWSQYGVGLRADVRLEKSMHAGFARDTSYYRAIVRADGMSLWHEPYTPDSGPTTSPFIVLGAR